MHNVWLLIASSPGTKSEISCSIREACLKALQLHMQRRFSRGCARHQILKTLAGHLPSMCNLGDICGRATTNIWKALQAHLLLNGYCGQFMAGPEGPIPCDGAGELNINFQKAHECHLLLNGDCRQLVARPEDAILCSCSGILQRRCCQLKLLLQLLIQSLLICWPEIPAVSTWLPASHSAATFLLQLCPVCQNVQLLHSAYLYFMTCWKLARSAR